MKHKTFYLDAFDARKIFFNQWTGEQPPIANLVLIHGMGEHSGRYQHFAEFFVENKIDVYALDLFGHGNTEGKRGHTPSMDDFLWQVDMIVKMVKQLGGPTFLYGHSMGGGIVLNYLFKKHPELAGVVASAPAIKPGFEVPKSKLIVGKVGRKLFPSVTQKNGLALEGISKDQAVINAYQADPLVHDFISAEVGIGVIEWGQWLTDLEVDTLAIPLLIMHGDKDILTQHDASKDFIAKFKAGDVSFKSWPGLFHELHNEPEKQEVFDYVLGWIKTKIG